MSHVRGGSDHLLLSCETLRAFVRRDYWSGKTLQPQGAELPPLLSFLGSQRFGRVVCDGASAAASTPSLDATVGS
mgnify:CR=1 FL=1